MRPFFDHFMPEPCGRKNDLFDKKNYFTKFVSTLFKKSQNFRSLALTQLKLGLKNFRGGSYMTPPRHQ